MKKFIYLIIFAAVFSACSEELTMNPALSLFNEKPEVLDETAIFRLAVVNMPDSTERIFPVTFGGTAERGVDYEASADAFVFGGESPVDSIVVTTFKFGTDKTVSMTVGLPEGMEGGKYLTSEYTIQDNPAYITFRESYGILADSLVTEFELTDRKGNAKILAKDIEVALKVNHEKSTAVEGIDFEFADSSHFTIRAGEQRGELKIKLLKPELQAGKDRIVLHTVHDEIFGDGEFHEMEIDLMDGRWSDLNGKWTIDTLITDAAYMEAFWGDSCSGYDLMPKYRGADAVTFELEDCSFEPSFYSYFETYFIGDSHMRKGPIRKIDLGDGGSADIQTFLIDNTNRYFSQETSSEDKESYIGMRIIEGLEESPDTLDFYVIDYTSKSFMPELETENKYAPEKPVAASLGQYLNIIFVK